MNWSRPDPSSTSTTGKDRTKMISIVLFLADQFICGILVGPLTVFAWWGLWNYMNAHLFPDRMDLSGFVCFAIGNCGLLTLAFTQNLWKKYVRVNDAAHWIFGYHFYTCICFAFNVCHWRGMWLLLDYYTGVSYLSCWITYAVGQGMLWIFRCSRNAQAPPMIVVSDRDVDFFSYSTRFRISPQLHEKYIFDVFFTVFIIHHLVVFYWRGTWELMDLYLFPDNKTYSAAVSFGIAYGLMIALCVIQPLFNFICRRFAATKDNRRFLLRWFLETTTYFFSNLVNVGVWRGVWLICSAYVLPDHPDLAYGIILAVGIGGLMVMMCGQSLTIRGCDIDGDTEADDGSVCMCPNRYIRMFYDLLKEKKVSADVESRMKEQSTDQENMITIKF